MAESLDGPTAAPCGTWRSPISAEGIVRGSLRFGEIEVDGEDVYWLEGRPDEGGRTALVRSVSGGPAEDVLPAGHNVRSLVNSYGGGALLVREGRIWFVRHGEAPPPFDRRPDQRIHALSVYQPPRPLTDEPTCQYADLELDAGRGRLYCVREDEEVLLHGQPSQCLAAVAVDGSGAVRVLREGEDFYASPRLSPDGGRLCWLQWSYPRMPWDGAELWLAEIGADGGLVNARRLAGGADEAIVQPEWAPDGALVFVSDRTDFWNLYRWDGARTAALCPRPAEFAEALWQLGASRYGIDRAGRVVCAFKEEGAWHLGRITPGVEGIDVVSTSFTEISEVHPYHTDNGQDGVVFLGGSAHGPTCVVRLDFATGVETILRSASTLDVDALRPWLSQPRPIVFPTTDGGTARAYYYPPTNPHHAVPAGERPPLIVKSHGGPTACATTSLHLGTQYFTSRGFGVVDVDYRGSTGYGRAYRLALYGTWGKWDVEDCASAARYLVEQGEVDGARLLASGGSAGGFITLALLAFTDLFRAGVSHYGISSLEMIVQCSDKLEAYYPWQLIGPWPERRDLYRERSPLYHTERVKAPVCFFQGLQDPVVPPEQTRAMVASLRHHGVPVAAVYFEGEQHGFRQAEHIRAALEGELSFFAQVLGFTPADDLTPLTIERD